MSAGVELNRRFVSVETCLDWLRAILHNSGTFWRRQRSTPLGARVISFKSKLAQQLIVSFITSLLSLYDLFGVFDPIGMQY